MGHDNSIDERPMTAVTDWLGRLVVTVTLLSAGCGGGDPAPDLDEPSAEADEADAPEPEPEPKAEEPQAEPRGELAIIAGDPGEFDFEMPASVPAGEYDFVLANQGAQLHHAQIYRLENGVSFEEFADALGDGESGTFTDEARELVVVPPTGVMQNVPAGGQGTARGELVPGVHAVVCFLPDRETGTRHIVLGMLAELEVS